MDAFRWDYFEKYAEQTPTLRRLRDQGASARSAISVFPSNTFPSHYTLATGLYPKNHGMVDNVFYDPDLGEFFNYRRPGAATDPKWWGGEPAWITAVKQGRTSACYFWVGSETSIQGVRPTHFKPYTDQTPFAERLDEVISWIQVPAERRPAVVTLYLEETNSVGHREGPDSPKLAETIRMMDERIAQLVARLEAIGADRYTHLVICSDHGMASVNRERILVIEDHVSLDEVQIESDGTLAALRPLRETPEALVERLNRTLPAWVRARRPTDLPAHYHYAGNPRIAPVLLVPEEGGYVPRRATYERYKERLSKGEHGYDPRLPSMRGILFATGPRIRPGVTTPEAEIVHVYNLVCALANLQPAPNDGDDRLVKAWVR